MAQAPIPPRPAVAYPATVETTTTTPAATTTSPYGLDYEQLPPTGVRKVIDAFQERDRQWVRWGAVFAGFVVAVGLQMLLTLLAVALGVTAGPRLGLDSQNLTIGAGVWFVVQSLITMFVGGYIAARVGGSIKRADGALSGLLTWALAMVITVFAMSSSLLGMGSTAANVASNAGTASPGSPVGEAVRNIPPGSNPLANVPQNQVRNVATGAAWTVFGIGLLTLVVAVGGGAAGAVGKLKNKRLDY